ncbi:nifR3 family TIM-barrel protein [Salinisphaera sp. PC39]|uniref:tRNA dihydrouridine synthase DusB n=1 Tax=Salinisphaera sp. PC39 TaxID=1304156 RepID=UPI003340FEE6
MHIGPYQFANNLAAAPMAGVSDRPFRTLCRRLGAGMTVGEMVASNPRLRDTRKSRLRLDHDGEPAPVIVQIAGAEPDQLAEAARFNVDRGADIIDINMGCPAKKVCKKAAGSALLADETLVGRILDAVVAAVDVPVTLKCRIGVDADRINGVRVARLAEAAGIAALAVHGRTRAQMYEGRTEYATIRAIKETVSIPVLANGDVDSPTKAAAVLAATGADGLMIGRAACRRPWLFREIGDYLRTGRERPALSLEEERGIVLGLLESLHEFYGETQGVRVARKHIAWQFEHRAPHPALRHDILAAETAVRQLRLMSLHYDAPALATAA